MDDGGSDGVRFAYTYLNYAASGLSWKLFMHTADGRLLRRDNSLWDYGVPYKSIEIWNPVSIAPKGSMMTVLHKKDSGGNINYTCEFYIDSQGNMTKMVGYSGNGSVQGWEEYSYDSQGNRTKRVLYNGDGSVRDRYEYSYDSQGNMTEEVWYSVFNDGEHAYEWSEIIDVYE